MKKYLHFIVYMALVAAVSSCYEDDNRTYGIFTVLEDEVTVEMDGTIESSSLTDFEDLQADFFRINRINIVDCDGSSDDDINLLLSKRVHEDQLHIHLLDHADIASGAVDFFLAGTIRTRGNSTKIGVHAWSDGNNEATDFPEGDARHMPYIEYYKSIGFTQDEAEDFYYFTINAAVASDIHWMTETEIASFGILTP